MNLQRLAIKSLIDFVIVAGFMISVFGYFHEKSKHDKSEAVFALAMSSADAGRWVWAVHRNTLIWDKEMFNIFDITPEEFEPHYAGWFDLVDERDRAVVQQRINAAHATNGRYRAVYRCHRKNGEVTYVLASGAMSEDGFVMAGVCIPLTETLARDLMIMFGQKNLAN